MFCKILSQKKYYFIKIKKESALLGSADFYWTLHPVALPPLLSFFVGLSQFNKESVFWKRIPKF